MAAITLPKGALLQIYGVDASANGGDGTTKWNTVTDHNRGQFTINHNRIEQSKRMANGTLRKFFVADKVRLTYALIMQKMGQARYLLDMKHLQFHLQIAHLI
jgi:hypothetical protein